MAHEVSATFRELVGPEVLQLFHTLRYGGDCVTTAVTLEPPASLEAVTAAAAKLQARHAMLRAALRFDGRGEPFFDCTAGGAVEVRHYDEGDAQEVAEKELHDIPPLQTCGWRLAVCGPHILHTYQHSFMDGVSVMVILKELIEILSGHELEDSDASGEIPRPCRDLVLEALSEEDAQPRSTAETPASGWSEEAWAGPDEEMASRSRTKQIWARLSAGETEQLLARCRKEGTTMLSAIAAAASFAVSVAVPGAPAVCNAHVAVDLRPLCKVAAHGLGDYVGLAKSPLVSSLPFWRRARVYKHSLSRAIEQRHHLGFPLQDVPYQARCSVDTRLLEERNFNPNSVFFSNRGAWQLSTEAYRATAVHFVRSLVYGDSTVVSACTVSGELCLTICYPERDGQPFESGPAVAEHLVAELKRQAAEDAAEGAAEDGGLSSDRLFEELVAAVVADDEEAVRNFKGDVNMLGFWSQDHLLQPPPPAAYPALNVAVANRSKCLEALLSSKADPSVQDVSGLDAVHVAMLTEQYELPDVLRGRAQALEPSLVGTWVPTRSSEWSWPERAADARTLHWWYGNNTCWWQSGEQEGCAEVVAPCSEEGAYRVQYIVSHVEPAIILPGTLTMLPDGTYSVHFDEALAGCEYMMRIAEEPGGGPQVAEEAFGGPEAAEEAYVGPEAAEEAYGGPEAAEEAYGGPEAAEEAYGGPEAAEEAGGGPEAAEEAGGGPEAAASTGEEPT